MKKPMTPQEIGREIGREIGEGILQAIRQAPQAPQAPQALQEPDEPEEPPEWEPPKIKSMNPKAGPVVGGQEVKIEFEEDLPEVDAFVKFGGTHAQKRKFKPPRTLLVTTPKSPDDKPGRVKIEIEVYHHRFELDELYEYV